ncbi:hypothetical protein CEXT_772081 [Caerostris extrusa]|uniref:Uncharacterized protein n=1 Tax=Caerostris extrusa TaxID=172846 RepID=A0AAV4MVM3_CAEEX|nr:hypothetical protein CEXT_772081 [Caerostris extrusa]
MPLDVERIKSCTFHAPLFMSNPSRMNALHVSGAEFGSPFLLWGTVMTSNSHFGCKKHFNGSNWVIEQIASYTAAVEKQLEENIPTKEVEEEEEITSPSAMKMLRRNTIFPQKRIQPKNRKPQPCHL